MSDSVLPPLYERWISAVLGGPVPAEPRATCMHCAMADWPGEPPLENSFLANAKCCTYQPDLPNFNIGRLLADPDPIGDNSRKIVRMRIGHRVAVTPLGINKAPVYSHVYEAAVSGSAFGRAVVLRCPHYVDKDGGLCGMWQHRESVCATWFCKFERGVSGYIFWKIV